jgi:predicted lipoprotein
MKRSTAIIIGLVVLAILWWAFPPLHIRSLKKIRAAEASQQFNVTNFVADFWRDQLLPATAHATEATKLVAAIAASPQQAHKQFGRSVGISSTYYFFLRGSGRVVGVSADSIDLSLKDAGDVVDISVPLGPVFGDAVRDGTGLLSPSDYPNAQDFNGISAALDHTVETQVLPELQSLAKLGARVQFAGCAEVDDESQDLKPLKLVPVLVKPE